MVVDDLKVNYHSYLDDIHESIDPIIKKMREQNRGKWRGKAWMGPLRQIGQSAKHLKVLKTIQWSSLPLVGPAITAYAAGKYGEIPLWGIIVAAAGVLFAIYFVLVKVFEGKMAVIGDDRFHVEAFKIKRPAEYEKIWSHFVERQDFTFHGLAGFVNAVFKISPTGDASQVVIFAEGRIEEIRESRVELEQTIESQQEIIGLLQDEVASSEQAVVYLIGLLKKMNESLFRYVNDQLELHDLDFVAGFSLYRMEGTVLYPIMNKGTSGSHNHPIDLLNPGRPYAVVDAAMWDDDTAVKHIPYEGRMVVAFRMKMLDDEVWIWAFHFDLDDARALSLIESNAIIESRQIRRMIHALCLVLQKRELAGKEVGQDAAS